MLNSFGNNPLYRYICVGNEMFPRETKLRVATKEKCSITAEIEGSPIARVKASRSFACKEGAGAMVVNLDAIAHALPKLNATQVSSDCSI